MSVEISQEVKDIIKDKDAIKVLASVDPSGNPHVVVKGSISVNEDGKIVYLELLESSRTNKNLVNSLWFDKKVAINVISQDNQSFQIKGKPVKILVAGHVYEEFYKQAQEEDPENDLAAVYIIEPEEITEETYSKRKETEEKKHPLYIHLDRLAR